MIKKFFWTLVLFVLAREGGLRAEVQQIILHWNAAVCYDICIPRLEGNLKSIPSVSNVQINARSGTAAMGWDPNIPFSYEPFRIAAWAAGIYVSDMRIKVKGNVSHAGDIFYLISLGDGASFQIIGPLHADPNIYVPRYNLASRPLSVETKEQLLEAERQGLPVTIAGPLYLPAQYPRIIIAEQIKVQAPPKQR